MRGVALVELLTNSGERRPGYRGLLVEDRVMFQRSSGPSFRERDRQVATLLRPRFEEIWLDAERRRHGVRGGDMFLGPDGPVAGRRQSPPNP